MSYNGWSNYETWRVALEFFDDDHVRENYRHKPDEYELSKALQDEVEGYLEEMGSGTGVVLDYALAFVDSVNWCEIAEHLLEGWEDEEDEEEEEEKE